MNAVNRSARGFALVAVLLILVMAVVLVVAFTLTMRTERVVASNMIYTQRTELMVQSAMADAVSLLAKNIPDPSDPTVEVANCPGKNWFTNPGRLTTIEDTGGQVITTTIPLYSGEAASASSDNAVNLNAPSQVTLKYPITGANDPMWIAWRNVLQDPSQPASAANKTVGRYAFWIDDESTKINFNVARGKSPQSGSSGVLPSDWATQSDRDLSPYMTPTFDRIVKDADGQDVKITYPLSHPGSINLDTLGVDVDSLTTAVSVRGFSTSPEEIKEFATGDPDAFYESNKFNLTPFSRSPEFNVFGKPRIYMGNGSSDLANGPMYQHYSNPAQPMLFWAVNGGLRDSDTDSLTTSPLTTASMWQLRAPPAKALAQALERPWPGMPGMRFRWSSVPNDPAGAEESDRIAVNMADFGYWAGLHGFNVPVNVPRAVSVFARVSGAYAEDGPTPAGESSFWKGAVSGRPVIPTSILPQLTELGVQLIPYTTGLPAGSWKLRFRVMSEYYYPPGMPWATETFTNGATKGWVLSTQGAGSYHTGASPAYMSIEVNSAGAKRSNLFTLATIHSSENDKNSPINMQKPKLPKLGMDEYKVLNGGLMWLSNRSDRVPADNGTYTSTSGVTFTGSATVTVKLRFATYHLGTRSYFQVAPIYVPADVNKEWGDSPPPDPLAVLRAPESEADATFEFKFDIPAIPDTIAGYMKSYEVSDARLSSTKHAWSASDTGSFGEENTNNTVTPSVLSKWASVDFKKPEDVRYQSVGLFSFVPVGVRGNINTPHTLQFHKHDAGSNLPDWLVLDLVAPRYPASAGKRVSDNKDANMEQGPISYMNSTAGKINLNSKIYPENNEFFSPPKRVEPLKALFRHMPNGTKIAENIAQYQDTAGPFRWVGEVCEVPGVADTGATEFDKELLLRNLASLMTTQSNTFGIWGAAQSVKKRPSNSKYGEFEPGDLVTGERRFYAVVERYVWPGKDGVPGNAKVDPSTLQYSAAGDSAKPGAPAPYPFPSTGWAAIDGPSPTEPHSISLGQAPWVNSTLPLANNPLAPAMKYRIIYFAYLN